MAAKWLILALTYLWFVRSQSPCTTPDGKSGDCKSIINCEPLRNMANKSGVTRDEKYFLKQSSCGFDDTIPKVCCPTSPTMQSCFTPENNAGQCVDIFNCDHIKNRLSSPAITQQDKTYVRSLRCRGPAPFSVCCGPPPGPTPGSRPTPGPQTTANPGPVTEGKCVPSAAPPDPVGDCCGQDESQPSKLLGVGGTATMIDQYPWLALIEYKKDNKIKLMCGGVLISGRYVLTAGHCVLGAVLNSRVPTNVRLGEYDTSNSGKDCVEGEGGQPGIMDCTDDPVIIPIERIIPHPQFEPSNPLRRNDIAMLRLSFTAPYTDFVRPICLPAADNTANFPANLKLFTAGWSSLENDLSSNNSKQHIALPYKTLEDCQRAYTVPNRRVKLWERQVCAGGELGKDSCKGDSGGPLMYFNGYHYEVIGIVSFGPVPCGLENVPGVYTKVFEYMTWIRSNIQP